MTQSYYLYADKRTQTLSELRVSVFDLAHAPTPGSLVVTYNSLGYDNWFLRGNELHFIHRNPLEWTVLYQALYSNADHRAHMEKGILPDLTVQATYTHPVWNGGQRQFDETSASEGFTRADNEKGTYYKFFYVQSGTPRTVSPSDSTWSNHKPLGTFIPRYAPVVVTDDNVQYFDHRDYANEFGVTDTGELQFSPKENLLANPGLEIVSGGTAYGWSKRNSGNAIVPAAVTDGSTAVYGTTYVQLGSGETLYQTARLRSRNLHRVSVYARVDEADSAIKIVVNPVDLNGNYRDTDNSVLATSFQNTAVLSHSFQGSADEWRRYEVVVGESSEYFSHNDPPQGSDVPVGILPSSTYKLEVRVVAAGTKPIKVDALQLHEGGERAPFLGLTGDTTVEYEWDPDGVYTVAPTSTPFKYSDVNVDPIRSQKPDGFLAFYAMGTGDDWHLHRGGDSVGVSGIMTPVLGRYHVPYSKLSGLGKLSERQTFHRDGAPIDSDIDPLTKQIAPSDAEEVPPENSYTDSAGALHFLTTANRNTPLVSTFYDQYDNPLSSSEISVTQVGSAETSTTRVFTDEGGRARYVHRPFVTSWGVGTERITFSAGNVKAYFLADVNV